MHKNKLGNEKVKNKYATLKINYADWQSPPKEMKEIHPIRHLVVIKDLKNKYNKIINISSKKALVKHDLNVETKAFFISKVTCQEFEERLGNAGFEFEKIKIYPQEQDFALSRTKDTGVYVYVAKVKK